MNKSNKSSACIYSLLLSLVTFVFIVLKLTNIITWSWWWVLSPIWIPAAILGIILIAIVIIAKLKYGDK